MTRLLDWINIWSGFNSYGVLLGGFFFFVSHWTATTTVHRPPSHSPHQGQFEGFWDLRRKFK